MVDNKLPPHDIDAEESVLGSLLIDGNTMGQIDLAPDDFYNERNCLIFSACKNVEAINQITVAQELNRQGKLEICGGAAYLSHLISFVPTSLDIEHYAGIVKNLAISRKLIMAGDSIKTIGKEASQDINSSLSKAGDIITELAKKNAKVDIITPKESAEYMMEFLENTKKHTLAKSWGFSEIDRITKGVFREDYVIIGARPSVGKSQLMFEFMGHYLDQGLKGLLVSLEMGKRAIAERLIAIHCGIDTGRLRQGELTVEESSKIVDLSGKISDWKIDMITNDCTAAEIANIARRLKDRQGLDFVMVDYIQILQDIFIGEKVNVAISKASQTLKSLAKELEVTVIALSQLNRGPELRADSNKRPHISELKESGSLEQDADIAFLLYRDELYDDNTEDVGVMEVKMAKNRQLGSQPAIKLQWTNKLHYNNHAYKGV